MTSSSLYKMNTRQSIGTLELFLNEMLIFLVWNLSVGCDRSTFTKYQRIHSQYPWDIKPVETPKSEDVNCSTKLTCSKKFS
jgi:hypothetical protein